jgi:hypothetical protein
VHCWRRYLRRLEAEPGTIVTVETVRKGWSALEKKRMARMK